MNTTVATKTKSDVPQARLFWPDALKVFACFIIVLLHATSLAITVFEEGTPLSKVNWTINIFTRFGVPVFLMVSGIFLLNPSKNMPLKKIWKYIKKALKGIILISILWTIYHYFFVIPSELQTFEHVSEIFRERAYHLWYLWALIGIYLVAPMLRQIAKDQKILVYTLIVTIVFFFGLGTLPFLGPDGAALLSPDFLVWTDWLTSKLGVTMAFAFPPIFALLGYYLAHTNLSTKQKNIFLALGFLGLIASWYLFFRSIRVQGERVGFFISNGSIFALAYAVGVFVLFKQITNPPKFIRATVKAIIPHIFNIYLWHAFILEIARYSFSIQDFFATYGVWGVVLSAIVIFILSWLLSIVLEKLKRIPKLFRVSP